MEVEHGINCISLVIILYGVKSGGLSTYRRPVSEKVRGGKKSRRNACAENSNGSGRKSGFLKWKTLTTPTRDARLIKY